MKGKGSQQKWSEKRSGSLVKGTVTWEREGKGFEQNRSKKRSGSLVKGSVTWERH